MTANAQGHVDYVESTGKKYVLKSITQVYEGNPTGEGVYFEYNNKLQLQEMALWQANWQALAKPKLMARNKVQTDKEGRITQIDLYEVPGAVSEPIEPYPHIARIVYEYGIDGKPTKRLIYDASSSLEEPEATATFTYNKDGKMIKMESSAGGWIDSEYNEKGQLVRFQIHIPSDPTHTAKNAYQTFEYNEAGDFIRQNFYSNMYPEQPIDHYLDITSKNGKVESYRLYIWSSKKKEYRDQGIVNFSYNDAIKREETYIPLFFHGRENPMEIFLNLFDYYLMPGACMSSIDYGEGLQFLFSYQLSSEILPAQRIALEREGVKAYKNGNTVSIEGIGITDIEIYDMMGKRLLKLSQEIDRIDLPGSMFANGFYLVKTTTQSGKKQSIKVNL